MLLLDILNGNYPRDDPIQYLLSFHHNRTLFQDSDTGVTWENESIFLNGRLYQRRTSKLGIMYDVRCVFSSDPEDKCQYTPLQLFKVSETLPMKSKKSVQCCPTVFFFAVDIHR